MAEILAVAYTSRRGARAGCLRLADTANAGVLSVQAVARVHRGRSGWVVRHGFPPTLGCWLAAYALMGTDLSAAPPTWYAPLPVETRERFDTAAAERLCRGMSPVHSAVLLKIADSTPLIALESLRPARGIARLLHSSVPLEHDLVTAILNPVLMPSSQPDNTRPPAG